MLIDLLHDLFDELDTADFLTEVYDADFHKLVSAIRKHTTVVNLSKLLRENVILHCVVITRIETVLDRPFEPDIQDIVVLALLVALSSAKLSASEASRMISPSRKLSYQFMTEMTQEPLPKVSPYATIRLPNPKGGDLEISTKINEVMLAAVGEIPDWTPDLRARIEMAQSKYGQPLLTHDGRDTLVDLIQELYDANNYMVKIALEKDPRLLPALPEAISALVSLTSCIRRALDLPK